MVMLSRENWRRHCYLPALLILLGVSAVHPPTARAQQASAAVNGVITDPTGAAVPGARINLTNVNTAVARTSATNSEGAYAFINVVPGTYTLLVSAQGFSTTNRSAIQLQVNQTATFDFHLTVGEAQVTIAVEGTAAVVEGSTSELGTVVSHQEVLDLPLNGRNFTQLLTITPGVANVNRDQSSGGGSGFLGNALGSFSFPAINGARVRSNTFLLDGVNDLNTFLTTYNFQPIIDDIQEFKTQGHNDLAEYGGVTGGIVSVVSKSGTNQYHGTLWEFVRNEKMDARGFFDAARVPLRQNQFGAAAGGPVWIPKLYSGKNRTFFYAAYEGYRQRLFNEGGALGPTDAMRNGDYSALNTPIYDPSSTSYNAGTNTYSRSSFTGSTLPATQISPISQAYQTLVPHAGTLINGNNIYIPTPSSTDQDSGSIRADQYFGNSDQVMFRFSKSFQFLDVPAGVIGRTASQIDGYNMALHETHTFGPTAVLDVYMGRNYGYDKNGTTALGETEAFTKSVLAMGISPAFSNLNGATYAPQMGVANYVSSPLSAVQQDLGLADVWQWGGTFAKIIGKHTFKVGADIQTNNFVSPVAYNNETFEQTQTAGLGVNQGVGGNSWASFLLGVPGQASFQALKEVNHGGWSNAFFVQDQWKATSRLTVNIGFRYDLKLWPIYGAGKDLYTGDANAVTGMYILTALPPNCSGTVGAPCMPNGAYAANGPDPYTGLPPHVIVTPNANHAILNNDFGDWAGRLGLAYRLSDKMVIRAGYGRFYDMWGTVQQLAQNFNGNWPAVASISNPSLNQNTVTTTIKDPLNLGGGGGLVYPRITFDQVSQWMVDPNFKTPYMDQWNFGVQQELPSNTVIDVNYVGSVGRRLDWGPVQNVATPGAGDPVQRQPFPYMYPQWFDQSVANSRYNALQISINKRASRGLAFQVSYTLSRSMDDGCGLGAPCNVQNVYNRALDAGISDSNQTNVFSVSFTAQSPFGNPGTGGNRLVRNVAGGWQLNGLVQFHSGMPFSVITTNAILNNGGFNQERADLVGNPNSGGHTVAQWFNTVAYANPVPYAYGNSKPNSLVTDWGRNLDLSLFRQFRVGLGEARYFEFRAEAFNLLNNVSFGDPDSNLTDPTYGQVTSQANSPRQLQLALKFYF